MRLHPDLARPRSLIAWGVLAGVLAGLCAAVYFTIAAEPAIDDAIAIEEAHAAEHSEDDPQVSRSLQRGPGLFGSFAGIGAAYGLMLSATAFALRGSWLDPFRRVLVAGTILAGAITVIPWFKYPPNPPAVGDPSTAGERQRLYFMLILLVGVLLAGAAHLSARLRKAEWPDTRRIAAVVLAAAVVLGAVLALMPPITDPIPSEVPANLVWRFRVAQLGGQAMMWGLLVGGFGLMCAEAQAKAEAKARTQNSMPLRAEIPLS